VDDLVTSHESTCTGRVAVVTGGSRGVGREAVRRLAGRGYAVAVGYTRDRGAAETIVEEVIATGGCALTIRADVADELDVERLFAETIEAFGDVDVVVHAAALLTVGTVTLGTADHDLDGFDAMQRTDVRGTFVVNRQAARQLRRGGAIVNVSGSFAGLAGLAGLTGLAGLPVPITASYAAGKGAVEAMTRVFARDLRARDITVNAVAAEGDGPDVAAAIADVVALLVSGDGRSLNGQVIRVDAGTHSG
jgi:3-oxoacyl-[acyl-carrier protein] reductase